LTSPSLPPSVRPLNKTEELLMSCPMPYTCTLMGCSIEQACPCATCIHIHTRLAHHMASMDVPAERRNTRSKDNVRWLLRNIAVRNEKNNSLYDVRLLLGELL